MEDVEDKEIKEDADELLFLVPAMFRFFQIEKPQEILDMDLTLLELCVLGELSSSRQLSMSEVGRALSVNLSTLTRLVDKLVEKNLVARSPDPDDRRVVRITLTPQGRQARQILEEKRRRRVESFLRQMTSEERRNLLHILRTIHSRIYG